MSLIEQPNLVAQMMQQQLQEKGQNSTDENDGKNATQNENQNEVQNDLENTVKTSENALNKPIEPQEGIIQNEVQNDSENEEQNDLKNDVQITEEQTLENDNPDTESSSNNIEIDEELPPIPEEEDPLQKMREEPAPTTVGEQVKKATGESPKNLQNLSNMSHIIFEEMDLFKAQICSALSGNHPSTYLADKTRKKVVVDAVSEYLSSQEIKAPTPFGTLVLALGLWLLPSVGTAFYQKYKLKAAQKAAAPPISNPTTIPSEGEAAPKDEPKTHPYQHLKEYQENRRAFSIHKTKGVYNKLPNGTFCPIATAEEIPSPEIQALLDEGLSSAEIREKNLHLTHETKKESFFPNLFWKASFRKDL